MDTAGKGRDMGLEVTGVGWGDIIFAGSLWWEGD